MSHKGTDILGPTAHNVEESMGSFVDFATGAGGSTDSRAIPDMGGGMPDMGGGMPDAGGAMPDMGGGMPDKNGTANRHCHSHSGPHRDERTGQFVTPKLDHPDGVAGTDNGHASGCGCNKCRGGGLY